MVMIHSRYWLLLVMALGSALLGACSETPETPEATSPAAASETSSSNDAVSEPAATTESASEPAALPTDTVLEANQAEVNTADDTNTDRVEVTTDADQALLAADAGATLYDKKCKICHDSGMLNAPKLSDKAAWAPRIAKDKETLYLHSAKGFNKMPAQVNADVSEAQVHAAVDYMIDATS